MVDQLVEVYFVLYAESVPQVAANYHPSESQVFGLAYAFQTHSSEGIDPFVDESAVVCIIHFFLCQRSFYFVM